jgi:hypothetical protein
MRTAELLLVSLPVILLAAWFLGLRRAGMRVFAVVAAGLALIGAGLWWYGEQRAFIGHYTPARLQNGLVVE